jgi:hypothetical protein
LASFPSVTGAVLALGRKVREGKPMLDAVTGPFASEPPVSCVIGAWLVKARYPVRVVAAELIAMAEHGLLTIKAGADGYTLRMVAEAGTLSTDR